MKRRDFLKTLSAIGLTSAVLPKTTQAAEDLADYDGPLFVYYNCNAGIDQSSWVDPRANEDVNKWATGGVNFSTAGNIRYAPMANNTSFFQKYADRMLVVNGVNVQSNSHASRAYRATGNQSEGYPQLVELFSAIKGPGRPMAYLRGKTTVSDHLGLIARSSIPSLTLLRTVADPNYVDDTRSVLPSEDLALINQLKANKYTAKANDSTLTQRQRHRYSEINNAFNSTDGLKNIIPFLPDALDDGHSEMHTFLIAASLGLSVGATFGNGGYDTHTDHDNRMIPVLTKLTDRIDYLWTKAEELDVTNGTNLADRLVVLISSDVGRKPFYNNNAGKDHYPFSSDVIMAKGQGWTNRVVGFTGPVHEGRKVNNDLSAATGDAGEYIYPEHIHAMVRNILGIDTHALALSYPLDAAASLPLLHQSGQTGYIDV
jgi:uncharacterized protein (DUF1501 family)